MKRGLSRLALSCLGFLALGTHAEAQSDRTYRTVSSSRMLQGESDITVEVRFALGHFNFGRDQSGALYRSSLVYDDELFDPGQRYDRGARTLLIDMESTDERDRERDIKIRDLRDIRQRLDLFIAPSVPAKVDLQFGVVRADIDLGGLALVEAHVKTGASESMLRFSRPTQRPCEQLSVAMGAAEFTAEGLGNSNCEDMSFEGAAGALTLDFTGEWQHRGETTAHVKLGFGALKLLLPARLGVAVTLNRFLASFDRSGFVKRGDKYYSRNYDSAEATLELEIDAAVGDIEVTWVPR